MAEVEDIQPLVCDNGTGMVKVSVNLELQYSENPMSLAVLNLFLLYLCRLGLQGMMLLEQFSQVLLVGPGTLGSWLGWDRRMPTWVTKLNLKEVS